MADLDALRPEVRDALQVFDGEAVCTCHPAYTSRGLKDPQCNHDLQESVDIIRAELLRLAMIETDALIALDCEHDWQAEHERAEKAEAELAAVKTRIAEAPVVTINDSGHIIGEGYVPSLRGKHARLVVEE